jgi:hypothetical protein
MALSRQMAELRGRHAQRMGELFRKFLEQNQDIDPDLDEDTWTEQQTERWRQFTAPETERFAKKREELATRLRQERRAGPARA